jgi:ATP-dependent helicase/nuclease subunit B
VQIEQAAARLNSELLLPTSRSRYLIDRISQTLRNVFAAQTAAANRGDFRPRWASLAFGDEAAATPDSAMPPFKLRSPAGKEILIHGRIDRVDMSPDGLAVIVDYRLNATHLKPGETYHGIALRLLIDLLALRQNGGQLAKSRVVPVAALTVGLLRDVEPKDPADSLSPDDPKFHLQNKPRGIVDFSVARKLDKQLNGGMSDVLNVAIKKDGGISNPDKSDAVESDQLAGLLAHTEAQIGRLADGILSGRIDVRPYRLGQRTPCPYCELRDLCRFNSALGPYESLKSIGRKEMLEQVSHE